MDIRERVVVHGLFEVDGIEDFHLVPIAEHEFASLDGDAAFWVSDHIRAVELHEVGLNEKPGLTGAGAAHHQHVLVPRGLGVFWAVTHLIMIFSFTTIIS